MTATFRALVQASKAFMFAPTGADVLAMKGSLLARGLRKLASQQAGISLVELLVAQTVFLLVMGAALSMIDTQTQVAPRDRERAFAMRELQVGLGGMVRELRHTKTIVLAGPNRIEVELMRKSELMPQGVLRRVGYDCQQTPATDDPDHPYDQTYRRCVRVEGPPGPDPLTGYDTGRTVIHRVLAPTAGTPVFAYNTDAPGDPRDTKEATYVTTTVKAPSQGERRESRSLNVGHEIVLTDGFFMPNRSDVG